MEDYVFGEEVMKGLAEMVYSKEYEVVKAAVRLVWTMVKHKKATLVLMEDITFLFAFRAPFGTEMYPFVSQNRLKTAYLGVLCLLNFTLISDFTEYFDILPIIEHILYLTKMSQREAYRDSKLMQRIFKICIFIVENVNLEWEGDDKLLEEIHDINKEFIPILLDSLFAQTG